MKYSKNGKRTEGLFEKIQKTGKENLFSDPALKSEALAYVNEGSNWSKGHVIEEVLRNKLFSNMGRNEDVIINLRLIIRDKSGKVLGSTSYIELDAVHINTSTQKLNRIVSVKSNAKNADITDDIRHLENINKLADEGNGLIQVLQEQGWLTRKMKNAKFATIEGYNLRTNKDFVWKPSEFQRLIESDLSFYSEASGTWYKVSPADLNISNETFNKAAYEAVHYKFK